MKKDLCLHVRQDEPIELEIRWPKSILRLNIIPQQYKCKNYFHLADCQKATGTKLIAFQIIHEPSMLPMSKVEKCI